MCWGSRVKTVDANRIDKIIGKTASVELDSLVVVSEKRMLHKQQAIMGMTLTLSTLYWSRTETPLAADCWHQDALQNPTGSPCSHQTLQLIHLRSRDGQERHRDLRWLQPPLCSALSSLVVI